MYGKRPNLHGMRYWHSDWWRFRRALFKNKYDTGRCWRCGRDSQVLQVHHKNYKHLWNERDTDLLILCPKCHETVHSSYYRVRFLKEESAAAAQDTGTLTIRAITQSDLDRLDALARRRKQYDDSESTARPASVLSSFTSMPEHGIVGYKSSVHASVNRRST